MDLAIFSNTNLVTAVICTVITCGMGGIGWAIRRGLRKYEAALKAAEASRAKLSEKELTELKSLVMSLQTSVQNLTSNNRELKGFLAGWAKRLTGEVEKILKLSNGEVEELRGILDGLINFLGAAKNSDDTTIKQIGDDLYLVHKGEKPEGGKKP